jgi:hypothetical protein
MIECKVEENKLDCNCSYPCEKKGICCECLKYHLGRNEVPACFFPDEIERTYNRSIEKYIEIYQQSLKA